VEKKKWGLLPDIGGILSERLAILGGNVEKRVVQV
jgi:hypothetical protein